MEHTDFTKKQNKPDGTETQAGPDTTPDPTAPQAAQEVAPPTPKTPPPAQPPAAPDPEKPENSSSLGPIVGAIIIVAILVLGGLYYWGADLAQNQNAPTPEEIMNEPDPQLQSIETQSSSDTVTSIEADLEATNLESLDQELDQIENEF